MIIAIVGTFLGCLIGFIVGIIQTIPVDKRDSAVKKEAPYCWSRYWIRPQKVSGSIVFSPISLDFIYKNRLRNILQSESYKMQE